MKTLTNIYPDVDHIMRWLKANGIEHEAHQIGANILVTETTIEYETVVPPYGRARWLVPHTKHYEEIP